MFLTFLFITYFLDDVFLRVVLFYLFAVSIILVLVTVYRELRFDLFIYQHPLSGCCGALNTTEYEDDNTSIAPWNLNSPRNECISELILTREITL